MLYLQSVLTCLGQTLVHIERYCNNRKSLFLSSLPFPQLWNIQPGSCSCLFQVLIWTGSPRAFKVFALSWLCTCWFGAQHLEPSRFHEIIVNGINASESDDNLQYLHHALYFQDFLLAIFTFPQEHYKSNKLYYIYIEICLCLLNSELQSWSLIPEALTTTLSSAKPHNSLWLCIKLILHSHLLGTHLSL